MVSCAYWFIVNLIYMFSLKIFCCSWQWHIFCSSFWILLTWIQIFTVSWKSIHPNLLVVALQILQKTEVGLNSLKISFWRSPKELDDVKLPLFLFLFLFLFLCFLFCSFFYLVVIIQFIFDTHTLLSCQDGYRAVRFNPYVWPSGQKVYIFVNISEWVWDLNVGPRYPWGRITTRWINFVDQYAINAWQFPDYSVENLIYV